jgi:hypothetical protein
VFPKPKQTETQSVSVVFRFVSQNQKTFFSVCLGLIRCFGPVSKQPNQTELCQNKRKQNKKNLQKTFSIRGSSKQLIFFPRFELKQTETQSVSVVFWFVFWQAQKIFFGLFRCFRPVLKQPKQTELMVWGIKKVDILTNFCCFGWSFVCFSCFETPKLPVSILKQNNQNKHLVSDSAETGFGSSFGSFDTKQVSEDTLPRSLIGLCLVQRIL